MGEAPVSILVGDVGGTNTRLALYDDAGRRLAHGTAKNAEHSALWPIIEGFLAVHRVRPTAACLGVAAPVFGDRVQFTNLSWTLDAIELGQRLGAPLKLVNDLHAQALACTVIKSDGYIGLDDLGIARRGPMVVLGAGTGLGAALVAPCGADWTVLPGEGGHARFAPRDQREIGLLEALTLKYGDHVSVERVVSGQGLVDTYDHLRGDSPRWPEMATEDVAASISRRALAGTCPHCVGALEIMVGVYADTAANLALIANASAVWLVGGITPRILPFLRPRFRASFVAKGRFATQLKQVPVRVVTHPDPGLLGASLVARTLVSGV
jgi:glucokinase